MKTLKKCPANRRSGMALRFAASLVLCLFALPFPALAETIIWNGGPGLQTDPVDPLPRTSLFPDPANPSGNTVTMQGGTVPGHVYGGLSNYSNQDSSHNTVVVTGDSSLNFNLPPPEDWKHGNIYGGYVLGMSNTTQLANSASHNSVSVGGNTTAGAVYGGYVEDREQTNALGVTGSALHNTVTVNGSAQVSNVYGGYIKGGLVTGENVSGSVSYNTVIISGNAGVSGPVLGGLTLGYGDHSGSASYNTVIISENAILDSTGEPLTGGKLSHNGMAGSNSGSASYNTVVVEGNAIVNRDIQGGEVVSSVNYGSANYNTVSIGDSATVNGHVYGGQLFSKNLSSGSAINNTVTLYGAPSFDPSNRIWGGYITGSYSTTADAFAGNTLNLWSYSGGQVAQVANFEYYNFILPASLQHLTADVAYYDDSQSPNPSGRSSTVTGVSIAGGGAAPKAGDVITLLESTGGSGTIANNGQIISGQKGMLLLYKLQLQQDGQSLRATVQSTESHPQAKALSEGRAAAIAFLNQGSDLVAGVGIPAARASVAAAARRAGIGTGGYSLVPFFAGQGGTARYNSGSHVNVDGFSMMTGLAWNKQSDYGQLLLGAFFEAGIGNYDSHNSFSGYASVKGDGDTKYYGGGILGRFDFNNTGPGNIYTEASFRAGAAETDFSSSDLRDPTGRKASYDSDTTYYGMHLGLGYIWNIGEASSLDIYTKYFWTHQDSDSVTVIDDPVHFKSSDSHRWRGGARFSHTFSAEDGPSFTPYIGAAYEHEFDGEAKATTYGNSIDAPELEGGTGMGELGLSIKPSAAYGLVFDLGVQGYTGMREGVTGSVQLKWEF